MKAIFLHFLVLGLAVAGHAQTAAPSAQPAAPPAPPEATMSFEEYEPRSTLVVPEHPVTRAKYPFVDVHNHQDSDEMTPTQVDEVVAAMDELNYRPSPGAQGLRGRTFTLGVLVPDIRNWFFPDIVDGVAKELEGSR